MNNAPNPMPAVGGYHQPQPQPQFQYPQAQVQAQFQPQPPPPPPPQNYPAFPGVPGPIASQNYGGIQPPPYPGNQAGPNNDQGLNDLAARLEQLKKQ